MSKTGLQITYGYSNDCFHLEVSADASDHAQTTILRTLREALSGDGWSTEEKSGRLRQTFTFRPGRSIQMTRQNRLFEAIR